mgnify:CR=1 FL=1
MEHALLAEAELQKCLSDVTMDLTEETNELEGFILTSAKESGKKQLSYNFGLINEHVQKLFASATDKERRVRRALHIWLYCIHYLLVWIYA